MWYQRLNEYLVKEEYVNYPIFPCVFIKKSKIGFTIIAVYVNDMNLTGTLEQLSKTAKYLKKKFEVKDLGKIKLCLGLELEHISNGILVHQSVYNKRMLRCFNIDKAHSLSTPMVVWSLDPQKDLFHTKEPDEQILDLKVPYLNAIGVWMYLTQCMGPDIAFAVNLLARFSSQPI